MTATLASQLVIWGTEFVEFTIYLMRQDLAPVS